MHTKYKPLLRWNREQEKWVRREAAVYRKYIEKMKKKTKEKNESLWANIHKKRQRIKQGSGERMRKKGRKVHPHKHR